MHKPTVIEAEQFRGFYASPYLAGVELEDNSNNPDPNIERYRFYVTTIHGQKTYVVAGDWIIREPDGVHYYPCKPDVFEVNYEEVK